MAHLSAEAVTKAKSLIGLYPQKRSALLPLCHLAQAQDGWLTPEAMEDIAALLDITPAEVRGSASFYDMLHTEPVGTYVVAVCTNIACMLAGAYELLEHAEHSLGTHPGGTTQDGVFTLEEMECLAACDTAPCVQVNHRFFGPLDGEAFDRLVDDLRTGKLSSEVPPHGVLSRYERRHGLEAAASPSSRGRAVAAGGEPSSPAGPKTAGEDGSPPAAAPKTRRGARSASSAAVADAAPVESPVVVSPPRGGVSQPAPAADLPAEHHEQPEHATPEDAPSEEAPKRRGLGSLSPLSRRRKPDKGKGGEGS